MIKPRTWFDALHHCQQQGESYVLVTLLATAGSTPRDGGTKMLVCADETFDTIGGGNLEHIVTQRARGLLVESQNHQARSEHNTQHLEHFPLSSKLGQCCGGATNVLFEVFVAHCQQLAIYGAGHVAQALVPIIAQLPLQILWIDERETLFQDFKPHHPSLSSNLKYWVSDDPVASVNQLKPQAWMLVMTHNHQLDFDLVTAGLARPDIAYLGMIGSDTKARRFTTRLGHRGLNQLDINRLISPVGELSIPGKEPINVAVSIAAQLMQRLDSGKQDPIEQKAKWQYNRQLISTLETNK
ncbi:MAG: xanthine dehydrogenase accessory protein XdhC [Paraglaciecola sp.]|uniref:xanthine dehydrogenase accessory protein XdhC n=1 Tax=Paraglaciecola sp. TaxID=1920173 RepID=UPI00273E1396|nr:xanthine dehydrogenase accessory protein XdhC [Paraglaciecola sp.]MDP5031617.1 xanthine dehydrogenase accessory protein XdhC [Paraglaciecola sp.]MDP5041155.1 xanthine dehydrogenase accessory protein XdhC [Paraglaciecola sp.]MDP5131268.1 xanthine dehydrogenase accessory protein XdhC [Paraglaciecola sp.]